MAILHLAQCTAAVALATLIANPTMTPDKAAGLRVQPQTEARALIDAGDAAGAGAVYDLAASEHGDPVLYLDAGDAYVIAAQAQQNVELCDAAVERAAIALDLLHFQRDGPIDDGFRLVERSDLPGLITRAQDLQHHAEALRTQILESRDDTIAAAPGDAKTKRARGNGKLMKVSGIGVAGMGGALTVVGVVGLGIGGVNQRRADDPSVYGSAFDDVEAKGKRGNLIAALGFGIGGAAAIAGITLYVIGNNRQKKASAGGDKKEKSIEDEPIVRVAATPNGIAVSGRF